jgi:hypothetical protein
VCDWWKLRPKLGQVCDITNIHKLCRALGLLTTFAQRGTSTKKLRYALGWKRLKSQRHYRPNSDTCIRNLGSEYLSIKNGIAYTAYQSWTKQNSLNC